MSTMVYHFMCLGNSDVADLLIKNGATINNMELYVIDGKPILHWAAEKGDLLKLPRKNKSALCYGPKKGFGPDGWNNASVDTFITYGINENVFNGNFE